MPQRVGRIRQQLCAACPAPCEKMAAGAAPFSDPAHACEQKRFGAYDLAAGAEPIQPLRAPRAIPAPWGPAKWKELHDTARAGLITPAWLERYSAGIPNNPCGCRNHWRSVLAAHPLPETACADAQFAWSWQLHNAVNAKLGKPALTLDEARRRYPAMAAPTQQCHSAGSNSLDTDGGIGSVRV